MTAETEPIREEVEMAIQRGEEWGMCSHACPKCGMLAYFVFNRQNNIIKIACDDECGWKIFYDAPRD